jgi:hypothetical protein
VCWEVVLGNVRQCILPNRTSNCRGARLPVEPGAALRSVIPSMLAGRCTHWGGRSMARGSRRPGLQMGRGAPARTGGPASAVSTSDLRPRGMPPGSLPRIRVSSAMVTGSSSASAANGGGDSSGNGSRALLETEDSSHGREWGVTCIVSVTTGDLERGGCPT